MYLVVGVVLSGMIQVFFIGRFSLYLCQFVHLSLYLYELNHVSHLCVVESYNVVNNEWNQRPSLNKEKGSLAGAALNGKIFALGGGNGVECFSDVEMFDLHVGRWISARSMLEKVITIAYI